MVETSYEPHMAVPDDLAGMASRYRRHVPLVIACTVLSVVAAGAVTLLMKKQYTADAYVQFQPAQGLLTAPTPNSNQPPIQMTPEQVVETQTAILTSPSVARGVVDALQLVNDPEFNPSLLPGAKPAGSPAEVKDSVVTNVQTNLKALRVGLTSVFKISFTDPDAAKAARISNTFADVYIRQQLERKRAQLRGGSSLMGNELAGLRAQADATQRALQSYRVSHNLVSAGGTTIVEQEISSLNQQTATARAEEAEAVARLNAAKRQAASRSGGEDVGAALDSPTISRLREQRTQASQLLAQLTSRYGDRYPDVVKARQSLADVDIAIKQEVGRILSNLDAQAQIARDRRASVEGSLGGARGALSAGAAAEVGLSDLQRSADAAQAQYETVLNRSRLTESQESVIQPDAQITSPATPPQLPSSPNPKINILLGLIFGLTLGVGLAFVRHQWTVGLDTLDDVERQIGQRYYGSLPTVKSSVKKPGSKSPIDQVVANPFSSYAEAFRNLGASALYASDASKPKVKLVALTSALPQEGKTTSSVCLARVLAMGGAKVLMVDCDLRRRSLTQALRPDAAVGLIEVLDGKARLADAIVLDEPSGAYILPLGKDAQLAKSPFASEQLDQLLEVLRGQFDVVVFDTAPVLAVADTRVLAPKMDALVLLVRWRDTPAKAARAAMQMLESVGAQVSGVSLSLVNLKAQAQSRYGDPSSYYSKVASYYSS